MNVDKYIKSDTTKEKVIMLLKTKSKVNTKILKILNKCNCNICTIEKEQELIRYNQAKAKADSFILRELTY